MTAGTPHKWTSWLLAGFVIGAILLSYALFFAPPPPEPPADLLREARRLLRIRQYAEAESTANRIPDMAPEWLPSRLLAGEAAMRREEWDRALMYFLQVPEETSENSVQALFSRGEVHLRLGQLRQAMDCFTKVSQTEFNRDLAQSRLAYLRGVAGQRWEALKHYQELLLSGAISLEELVLMGDVERPLEQQDFLGRAAQRSSDDPLVQLGLATHAIAAGHPEQALSLLGPLVKRAPRLGAAQAALGELLVSGDPDRFADWHAQLPPEADRDPDVWLVRGLWARRQDELPEAARCFWETLRRAPSHRRATYQLGQVLVALNRPEGKEFSDRATLLFDLTQGLDNVLRRRGQSEPDLRKVVEILLEIGRHGEARAWAEAARQHYPQAEWPVAALRQCVDLPPEFPLTLDRWNLAQTYDLSTLPLPVITAKGAPTSPTAPEVTSAFLFSDEAIPAGIDFVYANGDLDLNRPGARMFEQTGGGVAVLDFDLDRWPDLYFPQGGAWPQGQGSPPTTINVADQLFRNLSGEKFVSATGLARLTDTGFGQGACAADFNNDGFPDLYVANVGRNQLLENLGDGTFADVSEAAGLSHTDWTTSCLIADLNGDQQPDLLDINYVTGPEVFEALCQGYGCSPKNFLATPDRLLLSQGDGTFQHDPEATPQAGSKGMGVVAADLEGDGQLSLFVTNDQVPNQFLKNTADPQSGLVRYENQGFLCGVAYNQDGLAMAGMGIAAGDADGNGLLDFHVTNFQDEANSLYLQDSPGLFVDSSRIAGLFEASIPYVGWGTQFLDADLDGDLDLVVCNGHIDDYVSKGDGYAMPSLLFENRGHGQFTLRTPEESGPYFQKNYLGRGMSRLDWNRDGQMDFVVSNMNSPASLVTNHTPVRGHFLNVRVHGTTTSREALGTRVTVRTSQGDLHQQLVGGDGYMASNERVLQFGLREGQTISQISIDWPSGKESVLPGVEPDCTLEVTEGRTQGLLWRGMNPQGISWP